MSEEQRSILRHEVAEMNDPYADLRAAIESATYTRYIEAALPSTIAALLAERDALARHAEATAQPLAETEIDRLCYQAGRAAGMEEAADHAEHWQTISKPGHLCGQYIGARIRAMKDKP